MKILFIVPYAPNRIRVRPYQLIRALTAQGHQLTVVTFWHQAEELSELDSLRALGAEVIAHHIPLFRSMWNCLRALPGQQPLQSVYCWTPQGSKSLQQLLSTQAFDVVHVEHLRGARYGIDLKKHLTQIGKNSPIVWDSVDCISHLFAQASANSRSLKGRLMTSLELRRTERYEGWLVGQFDQTVVTSKVDAEILGQLYSALNENRSFVTSKQSAENAGTHLNRNIAARNASKHGDPNHLHQDERIEQRISVVPNGVDLAYFSCPDSPRKPETIVFTGKMSYHANITAAKVLVEEIMPVVWAERPNVCVQIVGKDPPADLVALASNGSRHPAGMQGGHRIEVTGTVPDMTTYLQEATISVAPIPYGAGIQNKVLEAMACGAPVISSPQAAAGLNELSHGAMVLADDYQAFAQAILRLLERPEHREALGRSGRHYVEQHYAWSAAAKRLESIYSKAIQNSKLES